MRWLSGFLVFITYAVPARAQTDPALPPQTFLRDRGPGVATSMFGTYVRKGELLVYPFFEGYVDSDQEYTPAELGFSGDTWHFHRRAFLKVNNGLGLTTNATGLAPEIGVMMSF